MKNLSSNNFKNWDDHYIYLPGHHHADKHGYVKTAKLKALNELTVMMQSEGQIKLKQTKSIESKLRYQEAAK
jgi:flagellar basal body rod protein FlgC